MSEPFIRSLVVDGGDPAAYPFFRSARHDFFLRAESFFTLASELVAEGSQFVIATHSPILLSFPQARIYELSEHGIATVSYDDTETVQLYRAFLADPDAFLHYLSEDDEA